MTLLDKVKHRSRSPQPPPAHAHPDPIVTYHITQSLTGKLTVTPNPPNPSFPAYSVTLSKPKALQDTLDVAVHRSLSSTPNDTADVVGHCLIQVVRGKFLECTLGDGSPVELEHKGSILSTSKAEYKLSVPGTVHKDLTWSHDSGGAVFGNRTSSDRRLKLCEHKSEEAVARFAGAATGLSEFGVLEVYQAKDVQDRDWCGLLVLSAICVYAREERNREMRSQANSVAGFVGNWGGLLTTGVPMGP